MQDAFPLGRHLHLTVPLLTLLTAQTGKLMAGGGAEVCPHTHRPGSRDRTGTGEKPGLPTLRYTAASESF